MTDKELYKDICEAGEYYVPLFLQHWWMDTVCRGGQWEVALARDGDGRVTAAMPYHWRRKMGLTFIIEPQLTQYSGPVYFYPGGISASRRLDFEKAAARQLIGQIEARRPAYILQNFSPAVTNWLPFRWAGYSQTTRYTYRIEDISDPHRVFEGFDARERQHKIRRLEERTTVRFDMQSADFARLHTDYWQGKGQSDLLDADFIGHVCSAAIGRGQGVIASLHDEEGRLLAARFVVYDSRSAYSLMSAADLKLHRSGHNETLVWALLQHLAGKTAAYDFEGSMDEGVEYFYRSFGAVQTPFFAISKSRNALVDRIMKMR